MVHTMIDYTVVTYTLGIYAAIVISPGPNFALVSRLSLQGRIVTCCGAIVGLALAATLYAFLAMVGLTAILSQIGWLARGVQIVGGLYLIYLGLSMWHASVQQKTPGQGDSERVQNSFISGLRLGSLVNLSNPKAITFFVGLYAVAVPPDASPETRVAILAGGAAIELGWYGLVSSILSQEPFRKAYQSGAEWIERLIGSILILFGVRLVLNK